jgi:hypothetical protein
MHEFRRKENGTHLGAPDIDATRGAELASGDGNARDQMIEPGQPGVRRGIAAGAGMAVAAMTGGEATEPRQYESSVRQHILYALSVNQL